MNHKILHRRHLIKQLFVAQSYLGLKSLLLGVPPLFLTRRLIAQNNDAQFLIFSSDSLGSPVNCNAPGTYALGGIDHPNSAGMNATTIQLGNVTSRAAAPWGALPQALRNRMHFIHNRTAVNAHPEHSDVMIGLGKIKPAAGFGVETIPSAIAQETQQALGTVMASPLLLGNVDMTEGGVPITRIRPLQLKGLFDSLPGNNVTAMMKFRDEALDNLYSDIKVNGTAAQQNFLDSAIKSRIQARLMAEKLGDFLTEVDNDSMASEILAAVAACASKIAPVSCISLKFGGDNHKDQNLTVETEETIAGVAQIAALYQHLVDFQIQNNVTFAMQNVFGRTLKRNSRGGRDHNSLHSLCVMFGSKVKPGISGGITSDSGREGARAVAFNSQTGRPSNNNDIPAQDSLLASVKTIMKACGIDDTVIDKRVQGSKVIKAALL